MIVVTRGKYCLNYWVRTPSLASNPLAEVICLVRDHEIALALEICLFGLVLTTNKAKYEEKN